MTRILVVDDEPQLLRALRINLRARGYDVDVAPGGADALRLAAAHPPDLVVLDLGLPDMDGVDVIHGLRGWTNTPIIVLSGRSGSADKVEALDAGADDYVTKPFGVDELLARIRAATRRVVPAAQPMLQIGQHTIDLAARLVHAADGTQVRLTPTEWHVLEILARNPGKLVSQSHLLTEVWGPAYTDETHYLRQYLAQLRRKLEDDPARPRHLITEPGIGYRLQTSPDSPALGRDTAPDRPASTEQRLNNEHR
jgi:two-component system KDP operon response regulator KdpE